MATPPFVPVSPTESIHISDFAGIPPARRPLTRTGEVRPHPHAPGLGLPCPDGGYALLLAHLADTDLVLAPGEDRDDAHWSIATIAMRRAGANGRAPHMDDVRVARQLLAYDDEHATDFARWRCHRLRGIADEPNLRQWLADTVPLETIEHLEPDAMSEWRLRVISEQ